MESRLVLFIIFLIVAFGLASLSGYKKHHTEDSSVSYEGYKKNEADKKIQKKEISLKLNPKKIKATGEYIMMLDTPSLKRAHKIYTETLECMRCHGANGAGNAKEEAPLIAGQYSWYVQDQLTQMKSGKRSNPKMKEFTQKLSEQDIKDLAEYVSKLRIKMKWAE
jgi:cytochrome c553